MSASQPPNIPSDELDQVHKLRELVKDEITPYYDTDFNLLRWLKGHNSNLEEIVPKLKNHLILRKSHLQLDSVADGPRNHPIHHYWKSGLTKSAEKTPNALVNVEQTGSNDYWGILHTFPLNEIMKARIYDLETMLRAVMECERQTGEQTSIMYIMDLTGLKYDKRLVTLMSGALASISAFMSEHYVELIHSFVLVGAPSFITAIWAIAKPLLPERTKNKVKIIGSNWRREILTLAEADALPSYWNEPEKEEVFLADVQKAVVVDTSEYYNQGPVEGALSLTIPAGKTGFVEVSACEGQKMSWKFESDGHFAYGIFFTKDPKEDAISRMMPVYPRFNVPGPTYVPMTDHIVCAQTGIYKFWFSNEHAWFHTLTIRHKVIVEGEAEPSKQ